MKKIALLPLVFLCLSAGVVNSQAPVSNSVISDLQDVITANKAVIDKQSKTLDVLDQMDQDAQQLKTFAKRG